MRASRAAASVTLLGEEALAVMKKIHEAKGTTAASFMSQASTDGGNLPKVNVIVDAEEPAAHSSLADQMRASRAATSVTLLGEEALAVMKKIHEAKGTTAASFMSQ